MRVKPWPLDLESSELAKWPQAPVSMGMWKKWVQYAVFTIFLNTMTRFVQKNPFKIQPFHELLQYGVEKQHEGMQLFHTSGKGVQPLP